MDIYECKVCGYNYISSEGDYENNIPRGTKFNEINQNWTCPICQAPKDKFQPV